MVRAQKLFGFAILQAFLFLISAHGAETRNRAGESLDVVALTESANKSVVVVTHYGRDGKQEGVGSGFVISKDGLIATCFHVIGEARPISVELSDGRRFDVTEIHASDRTLDLAIVRIAAKGLRPLSLGDSTKLKQGAAVIAIGNPIGLERSVVQGIVSAKREVQGTEMIQLAMPIESGNSGGPLLDAQGRVQGLLNMKSAVTANLGFAVPVNALKTLLERPNPIPLHRWLTIGALNSREWKPILGGRWTRKAGRIEVSGLGDGFGGRALCLSQREVPKMPYEVAVTVKLDEESGAAGLAFASDGADRHYGFYPTAGQLRLTRFDGPNVFSWNILRDTKTPHYKPGDWNTIRVQVEEERLRCYVNDELVIESTDQSWREGRAGLAKFRDTRAQFRDFYLGPVRAHSKPEQNVAPLAMEALGRPEWTKSVATNAPGGRKQLLAAADKLDTQAQQLRRTAQLLHERDTIERLQLELSRPKAESSLFNAALLVAKLDNPDLELAEYHAELKHLSEELKASLPAAANDDAKVDALTRFLFVTNGFHGSRGDYYNPANSYVNAVLDDREGLPITLAVIYLELARSIGLTNAFCVPVPTHFMVMFRPTNGRERIIDVFNQGRSLTRSEAVELVAENAEVVGEEAFEPATGRDIVVRMLRNLLGIAQRESDADKSLRYLNALIAIAPESAADRLARARLHLQQRSVSEAKEDLRWLLDRAPDGLDLDRVAELYRSL